MDDSPRFGSLRYETVRPLLRCLMFFVMLYSIGNNGNILTDGTNERKYLERKYKDLQFFLNNIFF